MTRHTRLTVALVALVLGGSCVVNPIDDAPVAIKLSTTGDGRPITLTVTRGPHWTREMKAGPVTFHVLPHLVFWLEDDAGHLTDTIYVTGALGELNHGGKGRGAAWWQESFPVWSKRALDAGQRLPEPDAPYTDGITSATPQSSFSVDTRLKGMAASTAATGADPTTDLASGERTLHLFAEVNTSADYNATFTEANSGWSGQPSVVYTVDVPPSARGRFTFAPRGRADPARPGVVVTDLASVDTALQIVDTIAIEVR